MNLNNGAEVIHSSPAPNRDYQIVLAKRGDNDFVTWATKNGDAFWGHYHHEDFQAACEDYFHRRTQ